MNYEFFYFLSWLEFSGCQPYFSKRFVWQGLDIPGKSYKCPQMEKSDIYNVHKIVWFAKKKYCKAEYVQRCVHLVNIRVIKWLHFWAFGPSPPTTHKMPCISHLCMKMSSFSLCVDMHNAVHIIFCIHHVEFCFWFGHLIEFPV